MALSRSLMQVSADQLKAANKAFRKLPAELKADLRKWQRSEATPIWKEEVANKVSGKTGITAAAFRSGVRVKAGANITLTAGGSKKLLSGGGTTADLMKQAEFGTNRADKYTKYNRKSRNGGSHTVTRRTGRGLPRFQKSGHVAFPALKPAVKRLSSLAVQTVTRKIYDAMEGM